MAEKGQFQRGQGLDKSCNLPTIAMKDRVLITYIHRGIFFYLIQKTRNTMNSKFFLARSLCNRKLGWAKVSCWVTLW